MDAVFARGEVPIFTTGNNRSAAAATSEGASSPIIEKTEEEQVGSQWDEWTLPERLPSGEIRLLTDELECFFKNMRHAARRVTIKLWQTNIANMNQWQIDATDAHKLAAEILTTMRHANPFTTGICCQGWAAVACIAEAVKSSAK